jgi:hypothetical protein
MNRRFAATMELQRPGGPAEYPVTAPTLAQVCPHCWAEVEVFVATRDGAPIDVYRCRRHGDVIPIQQLSL